MVGNPADLIAKDIIGLGGNTPFNKGQIPFISRLLSINQNLRAYPKEQTIHGTLVKIFFTFSENDFKGDLKDWMDYQAEVFKNKEKLQQLEDFKKLKLPLMCPRPGCNTRNVISPQDKKPGSMTLICPRCKRTFFRNYEWQQDRQLINMRCPYCNLSTQDPLFPGLTWWKPTVCSKCGSSLELDKAEVYKQMTFQRFVGEVVPYFAKIMFDVFEEHPDLLSNQPKVTIHVKVERGQRFEYDNSGKNWSYVGAWPYFDEDYNFKRAKQLGVLSLDRFFMSYSGFYMIASILAPRVYQDRVDYQAIKRWLAHEIDHYHSYANASYEIERSLKKHIRGAGPSPTKWRLFYLWMALADLKSEGTADFRKKGELMYEGIKIKVRPDVIRNYRNLIAQMMQIKTKSAIEQFYNHIFYADTVDAIYYCGYIMCFFISCQMHPGTYTLFTSDGQPSNLRLAQMFNRLPGGAGDFYISLNYTQPSLKDRLNPSQKPLPAYQDTLHLVTGLDQMGFLHQYETSCRQLGLAEKDMVLTQELFQNHWKRAEAEFNADILASMKQAGFYPQM